MTNIEKAMNRKDINMKELEIFVELVNIDRNFAEKLVDASDCGESVGSYALYRYDEEQGFWDYEYSCEIKEIYEVYNNGKFIGYVGRTVRKSSWDNIWEDDFKIARVKEVTKLEWDI